MRTLGILVILAILVIACAPSAPAPPEPTATAVPEPEGPAPFTLEWWSEYGTFCCSDTRDDLIPDDIEKSGDLAEWMIEQWHELHPEYSHVTIEYIPGVYGEDAEVELDTLIDSGKTPNILEGFGGRMMGYALKIGIPLEDFFTQEMQDDYLPGRWESIWLGGHIPLVAATGSFYYPVINADLFEAAGLEVPDAWDSLSWDEFEDVARAVSEHDAYGACMFAGDSGALQWMWIPFAASGVAMFDDPDFEHVAFNQPEAADVLQRLIDYETAGYVVPGPTGLGVGDCVQYWKEGKLAVFFAQIGSARVFVTQAVQAGILEEAYEVVPLLYVGGHEGVTPLVVGGGSAMGALITDTTPQEWREAAFSFAQYVTTLPFAKEMPLYQPFLQSQVDKNAMPHPDEEPVWQHIQEHGTAECGFAKTGVFTELRSLWLEEAQAGYLGVKSPAEAFASFEARANELIAEQ